MHKSKNGMQCNILFTDKEIPDRQSARQRSVIVRIPIVSAFQHYTNYSPYIIMIPYHNTIEVRDEEINYLQKRNFKDLG